MQQTYRSVHRYVLGGCHFHPCVQTERKVITRRWVNDPDLHACRTLGKLAWHVCWAETCLPVRNSERAPLKAGLLPDDLWDEPRLDSRSGGGRANTARAGLWCYEYPVWTRQSGCCGVTRVSQGVRGYWASSCLERRRRRGKSRQWEQSRMRWWRKLG